MKSFRYLAVDEEGKTLKGTAVAQSEAFLERDLRRVGLDLVQCWEGGESLLRRLFPKKKVSAKLLIMFYTRLSQSLEVGLPIIATLEENAKVTPSPNLRKIIHEVVVSLEEGNSLQQSLKKFPEVFSDFEINLIGVGEQSGVLAQSLKDLAEFLEWKENLRAVIRKASIYPAFILVAISAVVAVWVGYLLPQMSSLLRDMGVELPTITEIVFSSSLFIQKHWLWMLGSIACLAVGAWLFRKTPKGRLLFDKWFLSTPLLGNVATEIALTRLSRNFSVMMKIGIPVNRIFEQLSSGILGNRYLESRLLLAHQNLQKGMILSRSFERAGGFPILLVGAIRNGERSGTLEESFRRMADFYDLGAKRAVESLVAAIGPLMVVVLGGIFAVVILSILLPLYDVLGGVGGAY
jgi:type IV pilus assembly protein PilC